MAAQLQVESRGSSESEEDFQQVDSQQRALLLSARVASAGSESQRQRRRSAAFLAASYIALGLAGGAVFACVMQSQSQPARTRAAAVDANGEGDVGPSQLWQVGSPPWCPGDLVRAACTEYGHPDNDCCAMANTGGCSGGQKAVQGKTCHENGAVSTCCPPAPGQPAQQGLPWPGDKGLFCFMVSLSAGGEAALVKDHFWKHHSIFACNEWSVFTDGNLSPVPASNIGGFWSQWGAWGSWKNTGVFLRAWDVVYRENKWRRHGWTVKVDPDTVWFPDRLRWHLNGLNCQQPWVVRNAGKMWLGAIEVFAAAAVQKLAEQQRAVCKYGIDSSGEDGFMNACCGQLGIWKKEMWELLHSTGQAGQCGNGAIVAYHPFKDVGNYNACMGRAR